MAPWAQASIGIGPEWISPFWLEASPGLAKPALDRNGVLNN